MRWPRPICRAAIRCACAPRAWPGSSASRFPPTRSRDAFTRLGFAFTRDGADFVVTPPSCRFDLAIEEDFIEEVARMHGYDAIPAAPAAHVQHMLPDPEARRSRIARQAHAATSTGRRSSRSASCRRQRKRRSTPAASPIARAESDRQRSSTSCARRCCPACIETLTDQPQPQGSRACASSNWAARSATRPPATRSRLRLGGLAYGGAAPEQWGATGARRRLLRRQGRSRGAGRAASPRDRNGRRIRRCTRARPPRS